MFSNIRSLFTRGFGKNESGKTKLAVAASMLITLLVAGAYYVSALDSASITTSKKRYDVGETMHISGTGFAPNATISITVQLPGNNGTEAAPSVLSNANGAFADALYTPSVPRPGRYVITATDNLGASASTATTEADAIGYNKGIYKKNALIPNNETTGTWTTGNAGSNYLEGNWTFYIYQVTGLTNVIPDFDIYYDHYKSGANDGIFIDALNNFRACFDTDGPNPAGQTCEGVALSGPSEGMLLDGVPHPPATETGGWINAIGTVSNINRPLQADGTCSSNTPDLETAPAQFHCFRVNGAALKAAIIANRTANNKVPFDPFTSGTHAVAFYVEAHLAETAVWKPGLVADGFSLGKEWQLGCPGSLGYATPGNWAIAGGPYGTDNYNPGPNPCLLNPGAWDTSDYGAASSIPGSSGHFNLNPTEGSQGAITLPIPTTSAPTGAIRIVKVTSPAAFNLDFDYTGTLGAFKLNASGVNTCTGATDTNVTDCSAVTFGNLAGGDQFVITETAPTAPWAFTSLNCVNTTGTSGIQTNGATATIDLSFTSGALVTCTYTNTLQQGTLEVRKITEGGTALFPYTVVGNSPNPTVVAPFNIQTLTAGVAASSGNKVVNTGSYTIDEGAQPSADWQFVSVSCVDDNGTPGNAADDIQNFGTINGDQATVSVATNHKVTCTYLNRKRAMITIVKQCNPTIDPQVFGFTANGVDVTGAPYNIPAPSCVNGAATGTQVLLTTWNSADFINFTIAETFPSNWQATSAQCTANEGSLGATGVPDVQADSQAAPVFHLDAGDNIVCTFVNTKKAQIRVAKVCLPNDPQAPFTFTAQREDVAQPTQFQVNCGQTVTVVGPTAAPVDLNKIWTVLEVVPSAWSLTNIVCSADSGLVIGNDDNNGGSAAFNPGDERMVTTLNAGDDILCTFTNNKPDMFITIDPLTATNTVGEAHTFNVTVTQIPNGATLDTALDAMSVSVNPNPVGTDGDIVNNTCVAGLTFGGDAVATCSFQINSGSAQVYTANASATATIGGVTLVRATDGNSGPGGSGPAEKTYVDAKISLDPLNAVNKVTDPNHTITATVMKDIGNGGFVAAEGVTVTFSVTSGVAAFVGDDNDCVTNASGQCSVSITSTTAGNNVISATTTVTIGTENVVRTTGTAANTAAGGSGTAQKAYVNARILIGATETNPIGEPHTFTVTVQQDIGAGFVAAPNSTLVDVVIAPPGFILVSNNCDAPDGTVAGQCQVTINSNVAAVYTANATATFNVVANGLNEPFTVTTDGNSPNSGPAIKTYVSARIIVDKVTVPGGNAQLFTFTPGGWNGNATFQLADATAPKNSGELAPGTYSVAETVPAGWELTSAVCDDGSDPASIGLTAGEVVTCTFTNTAKGSITIRKETFEGNIATKFPDNFEFNPSAGVNSNTNFLLDDDNDGTLQQQQTFQNVLAGNHDVAELAAPGWDLFSLNCVNDNAQVSTFTYTDAVGGTNAFEFGDRTANIALAPGSAVICTFKNRQANMPVTKLIDGRTPDCSTPNPDQVPANPFDDFICTDPVMGNVTNLFAISLFQDTDAGSDTAGPGALIAGPVPIPPVFDPPAPIGVPFVICEMNIPAGWALIGTGDVVLTPNPLPGGFDTTPTVYAGTGARDRCFDILIPNGTIDFAISINNVPLSRLRVDKITVPVGSSTVFDFTSNAFSPNAFTLTDAGAVKDSGSPNTLPGGNYTVQELAELGWDLTNIACSVTIPSGIVANSTSTASYTGGGGGGAFGAGDDTATIFLQNGASMICNYTNTQRATLIVKKDMVGGTATFNFNGPNADTDSIAADLGMFTRTNLLPGSYNWSEVPVAGWDLTDLQCDDANSTESLMTGTAGFVLEAGETVTCTFTNTKRGKIIVDKNTLPVGDAQLFTFTPVGFNGGSNFQLAHATAPFDTGFTVVPGAYSVSETVPAGWDLTSATCDMGETPGSLDVGPGETVTCTFVNTKRGTIIVIKDAVPNDNWDFAYTSPGLSPTSFSLDDDAGVVGASNDLLNTRTFNNVVPGNYVITETNDPAVSGFDITAITCDDAAGATDSTGNIATGAATYRVDPGETVTCTFVNTRHISAHTIGYWGNWNSCTGGKQTANELMHPEKWLLDEVLGIDDPNDNEPQHYATSQLLIGVDGDTPDRPGQVNGTPDVVRTCADGVNLLRKRDVVSKENRANDGAYNMTAQLVAALANYAAGSSQCARVTTVIAEAKELLVEIGFDGSGSFLPPGHAWRNYAIQLGSILDTYNNSNASACSGSIPTDPTP